MDYQIVTKTTRDGRFITAFLVQHTETNKVVGEFKVGGISDELPAERKAKICCHAWNRPLPEALTTFLSNFSNSHHQQ